MKKICFSVLAFLFLSVPSHAQGVSIQGFKHQMHQIFSNYNNARVSFTLRNYDVTEIHLRRMQEAIAAAQEFVPEKAKDGTKLDRKLFIERLNRLHSMVSDLKGAVKNGEDALAKKLPDEIFRMCVTCHQEARLGYLFRAPRRTTLFGEYMHKVSDSINLARMYMEGDMKLEKKAGEELKIADYYLGLLTPLFPTEGPSGVIMDKEEFAKRIKDGQRLVNEAEKGKKDADLEAVRGGLNWLCVSCHEPERIR